MARAQGARSQLAVAFESTYGTPPAGGFTRLPFASSSLSAEQPLLSSELLGYGRDPLAPIKDAITADGDLSVPIDAEGFGFWLKAAFGAPETTGTGPFSHEFHTGNWSLPSMAIETGMPDVPRYAMYSGVMLNQLSWTLQRSGLLTATVGLIAQGVPLIACWTSVLSENRTSIWPVSAAMVGSAPSIMPSARMVSIRSRLFA